MTYALMASNGQQFLCGWMTLTDAARNAAGTGDDRQY
ncbi:hypothetical protein PMIT1323_01293 [Prochlorococcus marinus str. MIT 1323]|nr:hypothetical protein PMIT1323_01293 [Prochlorococcus marinus str. MIT 1323]